MKKMQFAEYKKITLSALKMQWTYNKRLMIREIILNLAEKLFFYGEIFCTGRVLDIIVGSRSGDFTTVLMFILLVFSIKFFEKAFQTYSNFKRSLEQYDADEKLREKRIDKISRIRMDYYESNDLYRNNSDISSFSSREIDAYFDEIRDKMIAYIKAEHGEQGNRIFDLIMVTKYLERIGDHATNIAEWVEFSITGVHKDSAALHES